MAQTYVKTHTGAHQQSGLTATASIVSATAGNHLRLNSRASSNAQVIASVTDTSGSNTWLSVTEKPTDGGSDNIQEMWYVENCASGSYTVTVTYTSSSATNIEVFVDEFSGTATSSSLDQHTSGDVALAASPLSLGPSGATTSANENIYTAAMSINGASLRPLTTPPAGYTADFSGPVSTNATQFCSAHKNVTSTGTQTASWPWTGGGSNCTGILATFKDAAGGPATEDQSVGYVLRPAAYLSKFRRSIVAALTIQSDPYVAPVGPSDQDTTQTLRMRGQVEPALSRRALVGLWMSETAPAVVGNAATMVAASETSGTFAPGANVNPPPGVLVTDSDGNPVGGVTVTFAVTGGGGSGTGLTATSGTNGIATVGSWTLGASPGTNTMTATHAGLTGSPVTFTFQGGVPGGLVHITSVGANSAWG